jgi:hypothetical protein
MSPKKLSEVSQRLCRGIHQGWSDSTVVVNLESPRRDASAVGLDVAMVRAYIRRQEEQDERYDQMKVGEQTAAFRRLTLCGWMDCSRRCTPNTSVLAGRALLRRSLLLQAMRCGCRRCSGRTASGCPTDYLDNPRDPNICTLPIIASNMPRQEGWSRVSASITCAVVMREPLSQTSTAHFVASSRQLHVPSTYREKRKTAAQGDRLEWLDFTRKRGRGDRIRTCDLYVPNVALYQTELHPD